MTHSDTLTVSNLCAQSDIFDLGNYLHRLHVSPEGKIFDIGDYIYGDKKGHDAPKGSYQLFPNVYALSSMTEDYIKGLIRGKFTDQKLVKLKKCLASRGLKFHPSPPFRPFAHCA